MSYVTLGNGQFLKELFNRTFLKKFIKRLNNAKVLHKH